MKHINYHIQENLKCLSDQELLQQTDLLTQEYRQSTLLLLRHLREVEVRRLFVDLGFSSMHKYCIQRLKFSEGEAQRRLSSARLLGELPEIENKLESGNLSVTNLAKIQSFLRVEKSLLSKEQKLELIEHMENKPTREVEKELIGFSHQPALMAEKFQHSVSSVSSISPIALTNEIQSVAELLHPQFIKFEALLGSEQQELLTEFKNLYAHELSDFTNGAILKFLLEKAIHHKKKKLGLIKANAAPLPPAPKVKAPRTSQRKHIKASIKKSLWQRAKACCEYQDPQSKKRCHSKLALELDHIKPLALGGTEDLENLQLLCRAHNSRRAVKTFGVQR